MVYTAPKTMTIKADSSAPLRLLLGLPQVAIRAADAAAHTVWPAAVGGDPYLLSLVTSAHGPNVAVGWAVSGTPDSFTMPTAVRSQTFTNLAPNTLYTFTVTPVPGVKQSVTFRTPMASTLVTRPVPTPTISAPVSPAMPTPTWQEEFTATELSFAGTGGNWLTRGPEEGLDSGCSDDAGRSWNCTLAQAKQFGLVKVANSIRQLQRAAVGEQPARCADAQDRWRQQRRHHPVAPLRPGADHRHASGLRRRRPLGEVTGGDARCNDVKMNCASTTSWTRAGTARSPRWRRTPGSTASLEWRWTTCACGPASGPLTLSGLWTP